MSTSHQMPDWETPSSTHMTPKQNLASKFSFLTSLRPAAHPATQKESITSSSLEESQQHHLDTPPKRKLNDRRLPPWLACFGTPRKLLYCGVGALFLLILILGLAIGLSKGKGNKHINLPLPTSNGIFTGELTYYSPGPGYGACGFENTANDPICALSHLVFDAMAVDSNPNHNPLCGKKIRITRFDAKQGRNNSVDVEVVDRCTGCKENDVDLSIKMFETLADEDQGRVVGSWAWL